MTDLTSLLAPTTLGALTLPNRVVMAPMTRSRASADHVIQPITGTYYAQRASAGLLIAEATAVMPQGVGNPNVPGLWSDAQVAAWRVVTNAVHAAGGRIVAQLWHVGRNSLPDFQPGGALPVSASAIAPAGAVLLTRAYEQQPVPVPRALETHELPGIVAAFAEGARHAIAAGFDAVEIHGANSYLLDQFLRDGTNQRTDAYGGSAENRARLLVEVTEAVAAAVGADRTGVRLSPENPWNAMSDSDPRATFSTVARLLREFDLAFLHVVRGKTPGVVEGIRDAFQRPLMLNGGYTAEEAEATIRAELADTIAFGVPFIANPDLVARFRAGAPLAQADMSKLYGGGEAGYTDYPTLATAGV